MKLCRVYILLKDKDTEEVEDYIKDTKFQTAIRMSDIYAVIVVLMIVILKEHNQELLRLLVPTFKNVLVNQHEMLLCRLEMLMDECDYGKQVMASRAQMASKFVDIRRLFEMRGYEHSNNRKGHLMAETYKLKDTLVST